MYAKLVGNALQPYFANKKDRSQIPQMSENVDTYIKEIDFIHIGVSYDQKQQTFSTTQNEMTAFLQDGKIKEFQEFYQENKEVIT